MNLNESRSRIRLAVLGVLVAAAIILLVLDATGNLDSLLGFLRDPVTGALGWTSSQTNSIVDTVTGPDDIQEARAQIIALQSQVDTLQRENEQLREIEGEYRLLQDLFNRARESPEFERQTASIIGYDTSPLFRSIIIDKGADDGIHVGMPVESARGLVGQVFRTSNHSAMVILISDNISSIPARLGTSRATGIVRGGGLGGAMTMDWIGLETQIEPGEVVLTSGLGGRFPEDMVIGEVIEVERREADLFQSATIQPAVDFDSLEMVFIITDFRAVDTSIFDAAQEDLTGEQ
jgi:rod shape-determining protein MreC